MAGQWSEQGRQCQFVDIPEPHGCRVLWRRQRARVLGAPRVGARYTVSSDGRHERLGRGQQRQQRLLRESVPQLAAGRSVLHHHQVRHAGFRQQSRRRGSGHGRTVLGRQGCAGHRQCGVCSVQRRQQPEQRLQLQRQGRLRIRHEPRAERLRTEQHLLAIVPGF
jgi:hypothetical protein